MSLSKKQVKAAKLVAEDVATDEQIASVCGIDRRTLTRWKTLPLFVDKVESMKLKAAEGAAKATEEKGFDAAERLIELARLAPKETNGTIGGQVKACLGVAQIRGELVNRTEDVTNVSPEDRKKRVMGLLRDGAQRIEKVQ